MTRLLLALAAACLAAPFADTAGAQRPRDRDRDRDRDRYDERDDRQDLGDRIDTTFAFARGGVVDLTLVSGTIVVTGWDRAEARINARSERGTLRLDVTGSRISLDLGSRRRQGDTRYEVSVPAGTRVLMRSTSGDLAARGVTGEVEARTVSGDIDVDGAGALAFESISGDVTLRRIAGSVRGSSVSGEVGIDGVTGDVDAESVSGTISITGARSKSVRAETVSGEVNYAGTVDPSGRYEFTSHSGEIRLVLPAAVGARFGVETFSGEIDSDFPLTMGAGNRDRDRDRDRPMRMEFTLGGGGARITAQTFSGSILLEKAGAAASPRR